MMAPRHSNTYGSSIVFAAWLVIDDIGRMSLTRGQPKLSPKERAVSLTLTVPKSLFKTPSLKASITIPETVVPPEISAGTIAQLENVLKAGMGLDFKITVGGPST
jgi:hypothetical protein